MISMSVETLYRRLVGIVRVLTLWNPYVLAVSYHRKIRELVVQARVKGDYLPLLAAAMLEVLGLSVVLAGVAGLLIEPRAALVVIPVLAGLYAINQYYDVFRSPRIRTAVVWWFVLIMGLFATAQSASLVPTFGVDATLLRGIGIIGIWVALSRLVPFDAMRLGSRVAERRQLPRPIALHITPIRYHPLAWLVGIYVVGSLGLLSLVINVSVTGWWAVSLLPSLLGVVYVVRMVADAVVWRAADQ